MASRMIGTHLRWLVIAAALATLAACTVGPDYQRPPVATPVAYKEMTGWKPGEPQDAIARGPWWAIYDNPVLDGLERRVEVSNQNLKAAEAAFRTASALVREARSGYFPTAAASASAQRSGQGKGTTPSRAGFSSAGRTFTQYDVTASASWIPDVWGRIRRSVESATASAQASAADLASARLSAQALLATNYFQLRIDDELKHLLETTADAFERSLEITRNRYAQGVAARSDVVQAQAQLETTRAQAISVGVQRAALEHAIAVLVGKPPAVFSIAPAPIEMAVPVIPPGLPSTLLERRPDIAAAERIVAASNAEIGVAVAAYYPDITLSASFGFASTALGSLLQASNAVWAFGPQLAATLFDGGLRNAQVAAAQATYDQSVATYRQTVLIGFQQVEDNLAALRILAQQAEVQATAVKDAEEAQRLILNQYKAGTVAYTSVLTAQTTALASEQVALDIMGSRLAASVALIEAVGGGWSAADLPGAADVAKGQPQATQAAQ
jgi:NodT family efflux transporter outer membrane factor (OMF) lipoprotein